MTPKQGALALDRIAARIRRNVTKALAASAKEGVVIARDLSDGPFGLKELALMGHPYAQRHAIAAHRRGTTWSQWAASKWGGMSVAKDYMINVQTGKFRAAWTVDPPHSAFAGDMRAATVNRSFVAKFLKMGTSRMIRRPIGRATAERLQPTAVKNVRQAIRNAIRGH